MITRHVYILLFLVIVNTTMRADNQTPAPSEIVRTMLKDNKTPHEAIQSLREPLQKNTAAQQQGKIGSVVTGRKYDVQRRRKKPTTVTVGEERPAPLPQKVPSTMPTATPQRFIDAPEFDGEDANVEFQFEDADLKNLVTQIEHIFSIQFIPDEVVQPLPQGSRPLTGNKISFKTHKPLTKREAWSLFLTLLDLAGFAIVPDSLPRTYRITTFDKAKKMAVPVYINSDIDLLPSDDQIIRYVYFVENSPIDTIRAVVDSLRNPAAPFIVLQETRAFILIDKAYNIKMLMHIVKELDSVNAPQAMSVLKLQRADAEDVKKLYESLMPGGETPARGGVLPGRRPPSSSYFPENIRIIAEPRTNSLILLGQQDAITKLEEFVRLYVDKDPDAPYAPLYVYTLKYAEAATIAEIMNQTVQFGKNTPAGKAGGVRGGDKFMKPMSFTPEPATNQIIIKGDYDDYLKAVEIIEKLDEQQPQVALEVLVVQLDMTDVKQLGTQLRNKINQCDPNGLFGSRVNFQTSGINFSGQVGTGSKGILTNTTTTGITNLLGNLVNLLLPAGSAVAGNTVVTFGQDSFGVWGIFNILETLTKLQVVANPFMVASNKTPATVMVGEDRRVVNATVTAGADTVDSFGDFDAKLEVTITPQINSDGMIILTVEINNSQFINTSITEPAKTIQQVKTKTTMADKEILALGGIIQNRAEDAETKVPILGDIPILGWFFKNRGKQNRKTTLLVLISPRIIPTDSARVANEFTAHHIDDYRTTMAAVHSTTDERDPVYRFFFRGGATDADALVHQYLAKKVVSNLPSDTMVTSDDGLINTSIITGVEQPKKSGAPVLPTPFAPVILEKAPTPKISRSKQRRSLTTLAQGAAPA